MIFFPDFLYKSIWCGTHLNCINKSIHAIQMGTNNICLYKEVDKKYIGCNLSTTELLDCAIRGVCAVIRSNRVCSIQTRPFAVCLWYRSHFSTYDTRKEWIAKIFLDLYRPIRTFQKNLMSFQKSLNAFFTVSFSLNIFTFCKYHHHLQKQLEMCVCIS